MTTWRDVDWSQTLGGNDRYGDCTCCALANLIDIMRAPEIVSEAEVERLYTVETGWTAEQPETDKGAVLETVLRDWCANGWPSDPALKPSGFVAVEFTDVSAALERASGLPAWLLLPKTPDGTAYDFSDDAVVRDAPGTYAHAVLVVDTADRLTFVTWGGVQSVSEAWARRYFQGFFEVVWEDAS